MPFSFFLIEWRWGIFLQSSREPLWLCLCHPAMSCRKPGTVLSPPLPSPVPCCVTESHWRSTAPVSLLLGFPLSPFITLPGSECWRGKNLSLGTISPSSCQRDNPLHRIHPVPCAISKPQIVQWMPSSAAQALVGREAEGPWGHFFPSLFVPEVIFSRFSRHTLAALKQVGNAGTGRKACTAWVINFKGKREG